MATFTNRATLTYNDITVDSNLATGEILETLSLTKTAVANSYTEDERVTYVVSIINSGNTAFTGLTLTDTLGGYPYAATTVYPLEFVSTSLLYYQNGVLQAATPAAVAGPPLTITGITVPANGNATLVYEANINEFAPLAADSTILNTATLTGVGIVTPVADTETLSVSAEPQLDITKSISPAVVAENGQVTYTITIQNFGNTEAAVADNVQVTDTFDPILNNITVALDGVTLQTPADYSYNEATGLFETTAGRITVPAATFTQDPVTGAVTTDPGTAILTITGTI